MEVDPSDFDELVGEALDGIPPELAELMRNVAVLVEADGPPNLLGLYEGVPLTERGSTTYTAVMPDRITIFRNAICARATDLDAVRRQVQVTVVHEVAHHFGIDDARLGELGWA